MSKTLRETIRSESRRTRMSEAYDTEADAPDEGVTERARALRAEVRAAIRADAPGEHDDRL